jgi:hypothetical protein
MAFPKAELEKRLREWWGKRVSSPLRRRVADPRKTGGSVFDIQPEIASQEVVCILTQVEPLLGFKLDTSRIIQRGGYKNVEEFVRHIMTQLETRYIKRQSVSSLAAKPITGVTAHASK